MALYDTRFGLPQAVVDYLNQGLPDIYQSITQPSITPINFEESTSSDDSDETLAPIIQATRGGGGGGDSYSVYNPDPTRTRTSDEYSPYAYRQAMAKSGAGIPSGILSDSEFLYGPQLTGIPGAAANYLQNSLIGKGLDYLGNIMPINKRAILENELLGQGIMVDDMGRIVSSGGDINTAENIMAGYNASKITADTFQKRRDMINEKMKDPIQKAAKLKALDEAEARILGTATDRATAIFDDRSLQKDPTYQSFDDLVAAGLLAGDDDDDDYEFDPTDPREFFKVDPVSRKSAIDQEAANRNVQREIARREAAKKSAIAQEKSNREAAREAARKSAARKSAVAQEKSNRDAAREAARKSAARKSAVAQEKSNRDAARKKSSGPSYSGMGSIGSGGSSRNTSSTSSGLGSFGGFGFSDIRLKENVELIGKSPSNINIYKFNYKNNPTTYQGAMAHEVPWASVKHSNGYMMVDYNQIDVDFKKYNA
jgi:hypothetical protein